MKILYQSSLAMNLLIGLILASEIRLSDSKGGRGGGGRGGVFGRGVFGRGRNRARIGHGTNRAYGSIPLGNRVGGHNNRHTSTVTNHKFSFTYPVARKVNRVRSWDTLVTQTNAMKGSRPFYAKMFPVTAGFAAGYVIGSSRPIYFHHAMTPSLDDSFVKELEGSHSTCSSAIERSQLRSDAETSSLPNKVTVYWDCGLDRCCGRECCYDAHVTVQQLSTPGIIAVCIMIAIAIGLFLFICFKMWTSPDRPSCLGGKGSKSLLDYDGTGASAATSRNPSRRSSSIVRGNQDKRSITPVGNKTNGLETRNSNKIPLANRLSADNSRYPPETSNYPADRAGRKTPLSITKSGEGSLRKKKYRATSSTDTNYQNKSKISPKSSNKPSASGPINSGISRPPMGTSSTNSDTNHKLMKFDNATLEQYKSMSVEHDGLKATDVPVQIGAEGFKPNDPKLNYWK